MTAKTRLIRRLLETGAIQTGGEYVTKSGEVFNYETDLRCAMTSFLSATLTSRLILGAMHPLPGGLEYFLGVPETGTLLAFFLNQQKYALSKADFPINVLRASPKTYQQATASVHTVLPLNPAGKVCIVEDDVVSGATLLHYIDVARGLGLEVLRVVAVMDRERADERGMRVRDKVEERGLTYQPLVTVNDLKAYMPQGREAGLEPGRAISLQD